MRRKKMLTLFNDILSTYVLPGLVLGFALCFFFIRIPPSEGLRGYSMARRMMGWCYIALFAALMAEGVSMKMSSPTLLLQLIMVTIGILQAFLFTFALTTLIDVRFFTWRRFVREFVVVLLPALAAFAVYAFTEHASLSAVTPAMAAFLVLTVFYAFLLAGYVLQFNRRYHDYERRMADYFSDDERERLYWVLRSFYSALAIGVLALLYTTYPCELTSLVFTVVLAVYYSIFGIRFINYVFTFRQIEVALSADSEVDEVEGLSEGSTSDAAPMPAVDDGKLFERLTALMLSQRLYAKPDLTIEDVAVQVGESYRAVSAAINSHENTNFKGWVNMFRIGEAERLIRDGFLNNHTTDSLANAVGFANRISFYRVFKKATGYSPTDWTGES